MQNKLSLLVVTLLFVSSAVFGQIGTGEWRIHSESSDAIDVVHVGNSIYAAFDAVLLEYDSEYKEFSKLDLTNGLSDIKICRLGAHGPTKSVFVGYENGNIDQIINNKVVNIPGIKLATISGMKKIHSIKSYGSYVYFATGFGIVKVDPAKQEIKDTYYPNNDNEEIIEITFHQDTIFALTKTKLYKGHINNPALADYNQWIVDHRLPLLTDVNFEYKGVEYWNGNLYFQKNHVDWGKDTLFVVRDSGPEQVIDLQDYAQINRIQVVNDKLTLCADELVLMFNPDLSIFFSTHFYNDQIGLALNALDYFEDKVWFADRNAGLVKRNFDGTCEFVSFSGTTGSNYFSMDWKDGMLAVVPGAYSHGPTFLQPKLMLFEDEKWSTLVKDAAAKWNTSRIWDKSSVAINPVNTDQIAIGGVCYTPLSIYDKRTNTIVDTFGMFNSPLTNASQMNQSVLLSDLVYDDNGNLWIVNGFSNQPLKLLTKDGEWYSFGLGGSGMNRETGKLLYDYDGNIWVSVKGTGLIGYKPGSSITSSTDDKTVVINTTKFSDVLLSTNVTAIAMDFDNELWIGTDNGFGIIYNPDNAFDASGNVTIQRPKIDVNGEVDYILEDVYINDIEVDGGNRKWLATAFAGIILLSEDGLSIVKHFTKDNSPLISNTVLDIEIDHKTGEVFIVTDRGMMSYRGDATYEDATYSDVKIFPNPVRPDHDGVITIQGIRYNSDVKITDVAGNVVYRTTSNGGTATWNGRTLQGEKVASGVYLIWTASNINKGRFVGKVVVVN